MFGKQNLLLASFLIALFTACARPNYIQPNRETQKGFNKDIEYLVNFKNKQSSIVAIKWLALPTLKDVGSFIFKTARPNLADGSPFPEDVYPHVNEDGEHLAVELWMPGMSHGSSPVIVKREDVGTYRASEVYFSMYGYWEIRIQFKDGDLVRDEAVLGINFN